MFAGISLRTGQCPLTWSAASRAENISLGAAGGLGHSGMGDPRPGGRRHLMRGLRRFLGRLAFASPSPSPSGRVRKTCVEALEERRLFAAAYALIGEGGTTLVRFDTA